MLMSQWLDVLRRDLKFTRRVLTKNSAFTATAIVTLALGLAASTVIYSVVDAVLLKPLPYHEPERLVALYHLSEGGRAPMSGPNFTDLRKLSDTLTDAAALSRYRTILTGRGEPVRLDAAEIVPGAPRE